MVRQFYTVSVQVNVTLEADDEQQAAELAEQYLGACGNDDVEVNVEELFDAQQTDEEEE